MIQKSLDQITKDDIDALVENRITDPDNSVTTSDQAIGADGFAGSWTQETAQRSDTTLFFPAARDMALFASVVPFARITERFFPQDLERLRTLVGKQACRFLIATIPLL